MRLVGALLVRVAVGLESILTSVSDVPVVLVPLPPPAVPPEPLALLSWAPL
jgi:hypothetical protein